MIPSRAALGRAMAAGAWLALAACLSDAMAPNALDVVVVGAPADAWTVTPGADTLVRVRVVNAAGMPVMGATVRWIPIGTGAGVTEASATTDFAGGAWARWRPGTLASETPLLRVSARHGGVSREIDIPVRLMPSVVASLRSVAELPLVVRLGDTIAPAVLAIDPYGNAFDTPVTFKGHDTLMVVSRGGAVAAARRGATTITAEAQGARLEIPVQVVQYVQAIEPRADTLWFTSLGAEQPVEYVVRDDRGLVVLDTLAALRVVDTSLAGVAGDKVRAVAPGLTTVELAIGAATASVAVGVRQRVVSLALPDTLALDALFDTLLPAPVALDSLGFAVRYPALAYHVADSAIARVVPVRGIVALKTGTTTIRVTDIPTGLQAASALRVWQRPARVVPSQDTVRFDAVGDAVQLGGVVHDALGSVIPDADLALAATDSGVAAADALTLHSRGDGTTTMALVSGDVSTAIAVIVDQVVTSLTVAPAEAVVRRPEGAVMPLVCEPRDRNGYLVPRDPALIASAKGTVTGGGCADARVARSGYDTLTFALGGLALRVPVIVATRPDSVGVIVAAQPLTKIERLRFEGEDLTKPAIVALRPLVEAILRAYGNPAGTLDRARAIRDWVARTAIIGDPAIHPDGSTSNLSVLPVGTSWNDVNAIVRSVEKWDADNAYWASLGYDGYIMLDRLLGTLDMATGLRGNDGMMEHVGGARYRIRDIAGYRYPLCTFQSVMTQALWAAAGLHGLRAATIDHDASAVFIPELGRWVYEDPTFNEEYQLDGVGEALSPTDLLILSTTGQAHRLRASKMTGPAFDPEPYAATWSYLQAGHPDGMLIMGSQLFGNVIGETGWSGRYVQIDVTTLESAPLFYRDTLNYARVDAANAFPTLGVVMGQPQLADSVFVVTLASTLPGHAHFERQIGGGTWTPAGATDVLPVGACRVAYRSVDGAGGYSATAVIDVWVPRPPGFIEAAAAGASRMGAEYCS